MGAAALPIISGVGVLGGLLQGASANKRAKEALNLQKGAAQGQQGLFNEASPYYGEILKALGGYAGLPGSSPGADQPPGAQLPYTNVTPGQLGVYANPTDALRLRAAEDQSRQGLDSALRNFSFGTGQRGLYGSSIDASGRAALISDALRGQNAFSRQLAINAPGEAAQRLGGLLSALNPGLGAGPAAAGIFGQGAAQYGQMGQQFGQTAGGILGNYAQMQALRGLNAPTGGTGYAPTGIAGPIAYPGAADPGLQAGLGLGAAAGYPTRQRINW